MSSLTISIINMIIIIMIFLQLPKRILSTTTTCIQQESNPNAKNIPTTTKFTDIASNIFNHNDIQCKIRTSPNCLFPQWDKKLKRWDDGCFCMEETLTGGGCIGDYNNDGYDDIYYPRMDGSDRLLHNHNGNGSFTDVWQMRIGSNNPDLFSRNKNIRSNGCLFVDIDNDGDSDLYISTLGDNRFYLFINDGHGNYMENAIARGLANIKSGKYLLTAGFTIAAGDYDLDGDLDIITTEWLPWLDREENSDMPLNDNNEKINQKFLDQIADMYVNMTSTKKRSQNSTNARLFENLGPGDGLGYFQDVTATANIMPDLSSPFFRNRDESLHRHCRQINAGEVKELLNAIHEPIKKPQGGKELREAFVADNTPIYSN